MRRVGKFIMWIVLGKQVCIYNKSCLYALFELLKCFLFKFIYRVRHKSHPEHMDDQVSYTKTIIHNWCFDKLFSNTDENNNFQMRV